MKFIHSSTVAVIISSLSITSAFAGGYQITAQSAEGTGYSYAGENAGYGDGSEVILNPGALSAIDGTVVTVGGHIISTSLRSEDTGSTVFGSQTVGSDRSGRSNNSFVPNLFAAMSLTDDIKLGLGVTAPFGLQTHYDRTWIGRYQAVESELDTVQTSLAASYAFCNNLSLGASVGVVHADAKLTNAIDFGTIGVGTLGLPTAAHLGLLPQSADGFVKAEGADTAVSWSTGALYRFGDNNEHRVGLTYRAPIFLDLSGDATFEVPQSAAILTSTGSFVNTGIDHARVRLPEIIGFGGNFKVAEDLRFLYGSTWTRWSRLDSLALHYANPYQPESRENYSWDNSWRHAVGWEYQATEDLTLQLGLAYDQSPVREAESRSPRVPDAPAFWYSAGAGYQFTKNLSADLSYLFVDFKKAGTQRTGPTGDNLSLDWDNVYNAVSLSVTYRM